LRCFWYHLKGLLKGFWWPFRLLKLVKYSQSYGLNEVCDTAKDMLWKLSVNRFTVLNEKDVNTSNSESEDVSTPSSAPVISMPS